MAIGAYTPRDGNRITALWRHLARLTLFAQYKHTQIIRRSAERDQKTLTWNATYKCSWNAEKKLDQGVQNYYAHNIVKCFIINQ